MNLLTTRESWKAFKQKMLADEAAMAQLKARADEYLKAPPLTVVDKTIPSPSEDPHDYFSFAPYWWPDPSKKDGLPYIRRDGEVNPESLETDRAKIEQLIDSVNVLTAYSVAADSAPHAEKAASVLHTWFLHHDTCMNPNLEYGQGIRGVCKGRGIGIIDTVGFVFILDAMLHLPSSVWPEENDKGLKKWFSRYVDWLLNSEHGKKEAKEHNNHGTWYDAQVIAFALYADRKDVAKKLIETTSLKRILSHIQPDGRQPHELSRTLSMSYSCFNLLGHICIIEMAKSVDIDIWHNDEEVTEKTGAAMQFLLPYLAGQTPWPYTQIKPYKPEVAMYLLSLASQHSNTWIVPQLKALKPRPWNYVIYTANKDRVKSKENDEG
ncbi:MAG: alginate lyase family protein [Candidatus Methylacidiphilales bacterium]|nr:alginate lyase family protein [Candidatus Methylacidiphilales bacterium]